MVSNFCLDERFRKPVPTTELEKFGRSQATDIRRRWALADCASIIFGIVGAKKHNFLNEHCHGILSKFLHFLEHKFIKFSKYGVFSTEMN